MAAIPSDIEALDEFFRLLRSFMRFSERTTHEAGISRQQYEALQIIKGMPGREWAAVGEIAERLRVQAHAAAALVTKMEQRGLVQRVKSGDDRRVRKVKLTARGDKLITTLLRLHIERWLSLSGGLNRQLRLLTTPRRGRR